MGSIVGDDNINKVFWDKEEFTKFFVKKGRHVFKKGYITATNLQFDMLGLFYNTSYFKNIEPLMRNSKMIYCGLYIDRWAKLRFIDTLNFAPFSVEKWGKILNIPKLPKPKCFTRRPKGEKEERELEEYNLQDSLITYEAIKFLQEGFNGLGSKLKITIASTAMDLYRRRFQKDIQFQPKRNLLTYLYKGYYGGRCEVIRRGLIKNLKYYDYNSLYPSVMVNEYPQPSNFKYSRSIKLSTLKKYEGVCKVKISSPPLHIPYLPYRVTLPENKLIFPKGVFTGYYSFFELRKALELGYKILKFYHGVIYFKKFTPFKEYVDLLYSERLKAQKENNPLEIVDKLAMNSLYGKFAQKIDSREEIIHESKVTLEMLEKHTKNFRSGNFFIFNKPCSKIPAFINPIFSIYTTAYARDKLYKQIAKCKNDVYYYDTDSLITSRNFETSSRIGDLKLEFDIKEGILVKPKMYTINNMARCKGVGFVDTDMFKAILKTGKAKYEKFAKFKESNKRNFHYNQKLEIVKNLNMEDNKRKWDHKFDPFLLQDSSPLLI